MSCRFCSEQRSFLHPRAAKSPSVVCRPHTPREPQSPPSVSQRKVHGEPRYAPGTHNQTATVPSPTDSCKSDPHSGEIPRGVLTLTRHDARLRDILQQDGQRTTQQGGNCGAAHTRLQYRAQLPLLEREKETLLINLREAASTACEVRGIPPCSTTLTAQKACPLLLARILLRHT